MTEAQLRDITTLPPLSAGAHKNLEEGCCIMEAVAWVAGEPWTDQPTCACPIIGSMMRIWNDALPDDADRDRLLRPLIPQLAGSRADQSIEEQRAWLAVDWITRENLPAWLDLTPSLREHAATLRALTPVRDEAAARAAALVAQVAQKAAVDARDAARYAAWDAARDAAWYAARYAAWDAAWDAASAAAWDAWDAAWVAARDAGWAAAWYAARDAWDAARDAGYAAPDEVRECLKPTVEQLQQSAVQLVVRMLELGHSVQQ